MPRATVPSPDDDQVPELRFDLPPSPNWPHSSDEHEAKCNASGDPHVNPAQASPDNFNRPV